MATTLPKTDPHGRQATTPTELPAPALKDIAVRVWHAFFEHRVTLIGAGATYYALLALVPVLAAFVALYGLVFDRASVVQQVAGLSGALPGEVRGIIEEQLKRLTSEPVGSLGLAFAASLALSLWSASAATKAMMEGLNIVNDETEERSFLHYNAVALTLTLAGLVGAIVMLGITAALPAALTYWAPTSNHAVLRTISYALLLVFLWGGLICLYRYGPSRDEAKWRWLAPGTIVAVFLLAGFSVLFSWFARSFAGYSSYGSLGAIIAFMTWAWISMVILLLGAEINAEMEHQTACDTTTGKPKPMGGRGATMADTLGTAEGKSRKGDRSPRRQEAVRVGRDSATEPGRQLGRAAILRPAVTVTLACGVGFALGALWRN